MDPGATRVLAAFGLTLFAGLATGIGSAIAFLAHRTSERFLSLSLGFSAGVMVYVSFVEILPKGRAALAPSHGEPAAGWLASAAFFVGILSIALIDALIPRGRNPHAQRAEEELAPLRLRPVTRGREGDPQQLMRMGLLSALAIAIHNFPEGIATFLAALDDSGVGLAVAIAVALHNIPEGVSVSVPIFFATGKRRKAFVLSFLSGLAEPAGALLGWLLLRPFFTADVSGLLFGGVAGIMVYISLDELLPAAREYGEGHIVLYGLVSGMAVMAASLLLLP